MVQKMKEVRSPKNKKVVDEGCQTLPQPTATSTPDTRKRLREPTVSPGASVAKKSVQKRPNASNKEEEWVAVPIRNYLVEIADLGPSIGAEHIKEAVRGFFEQGPEMEFRVSLNKTPYRWNKKADMSLEEARA